jgi:hypothetical protein
MPLSEEEQRILHEMEEKLFERDKNFADRVSDKTPRRQPARPSRPYSGRSGRAWILAFVAGFVLLLMSFRSSLVLASLGFLVMLVAAVFFLQHAVGNDSRPTVGAKGATRIPMGDELGEMRRRLRARFGNRN